MAFRLRLTRWHWIFVASLLAVFLFSAFAARTPLTDLFRLLIAIVIAGLAAGEWRSKGHAWASTLSWTIPLGILIVAP